MKGRIVLLLSFACALMYASPLLSQVVINEGSNRNFSLVYDEDGEAEDWIELFNAGTEAVNLEGYTLTDDVNDPLKWTFSSYTLEPQEYLLVFCSGKDRYYSSSFQDVVYETNFTPSAGWSEHEFDQPFYWDGQSDLVVNVCSYSNAGYITNSVFRQTSTPYVSATVNYQDGSDASCSAISGETHNRRPNIRFDDFTIGNGTETNSATDYPAPYGNWYWGARNQMLYTANELIAAGMSAGPIDELAWDVVSTEDVLYTYIEIKIKQLSVSTLTNEFINNIGAYFHTNFGLASEGETIYLFNPDQTLANELEIACPIFDVSVGLFPNGSGSVSYFQDPTPDFSNASGQVSSGIALAPLLSLNSAIYSGVQTLMMYDINEQAGEVYFTTNGDVPTENSTLYEGQEIPIFQSTVIRARSFVNGMLPSEVATGSYLINVSHTTPIVSVVTDNQNLYGADGIFDNWEQDWERYAFMSYFDSLPGHPFLFDRHAAMQIDGGAGGSRSNPQHSFRLELAKGDLGETPVELGLLPQRENREKYSKLYFRNGSNMYLTLPYKDGSQVEMMAGATNGYYSAMRPVTVYLNGSYFGLYEMREKFDTEYFESEDDFADNEQAEEMDILSVSYWNGGQLRAVNGDAQNYWDSWAAVEGLDPQASNFLEIADQYFDMEYMTDYIIGESWMGNSDWPWNNIKAYRSGATDYRWRFATIDLELSLAPGGWTDCYFNGIQYAREQGEGQVFIGIWNKAMNNESYFNSFVNRYADVMNTAYTPERLIAIENTFFDRWVTEMPNEFERWADPWNVAGWMEGFYNNHLAFQDELLCKTEVVRDQLQGVLELDGQFLLNLEVEPAGAGYIQVNTISPDCPWSGIYYRGIPVSLTAFANENYAFEFWEQNGQVTDVLNPQWQGELDLSEITFKAFFESTINVDEFDRKADLKVYPNPASSQVFIKSPSAGINSVMVYSIDGKLLETHAVGMNPTTFTLGLESYPQGMLTIRVLFVDGDEESSRIMHLSN